MFKFGSPVKGTDFIDRTNHIPLFKSYLDNNQHVMIKAPRRFGKTSLVKHIFEYQGDYKFIYIDIKRATTLKTLSNQILDKAYIFVGIENFVRQSKEAIITLSKSIRNIKLESIGEVSLELMQNDIDEVEFFLHSLDTAQKIATKKGINIKFVMDEFQDIIYLSKDNILDKLRSVIQHHENITYVFLGSIESIMTKIFQYKSSPFFHFAAVMHLDGLDVDELLEYVQEVFESEKIVYEKHSIKEMLEFLQGHPDYSIKVLSYLYLRTGRTDEKINDELCLKALQEVIISTRPYLDELIAKTKLKKNLYEVLVAIANKTPLTLPSSTLYNAHVALEEMGLIKNIARGEYRIIDVFLEVLLKQDNDELVALDDVVWLDLQVKYDDKLKLSKK
jgi:predicted RNA-binding protein with EMAP domain